MSERKVVETAIDARQARRGRPVLVVLIGGLALAVIAWVGAEIWGESRDAPAEQTATPPAQSNSPATPTDPSADAATR